MISMRFEGAGVRYRSVQVAMQFGGYMSKLLGFSDSLIKMLVAILDASTHARVLRVLPAG